jgi:NAD(P)-dependent dehydrogenase (short-subunit alcohol dehydrogenase family)
MHNLLSGRVVVITGASSGLGRATAIRFAARGTRLVLGARREDALRETAEICRNAGAEVVHIVMDVTSEDDVRRLADAGVAAFGSIDVWVNNAGVTCFAPLEGSPFDAHQRVIETNLFGAMFGARAVVPIFRRQRSGVLINIGSILSKIGQPFVPSYVISKFALRGLSEALRAELADLPDVHICSIYPYAMNTEHFQHGANLMGFEAHAMPPAQSPGKVAEAIVALAERPRRELHVPRSAQLALWVHELFPRTVERLIFHALGNWHFSRAPQAPTRGNLYAPTTDEGQVRGVRPPTLSTSRFVLWLAKNFVPIVWATSKGEPLPPANDQGLEVLPVAGAAPPAR